MTLCVFLGRLEYFKSTDKMLLECCWNTAGMPLEYRRLAKDTTLPRCSVVRKAVDVALAGAFWHGVWCHVNAAPLRIFLKPSRV
jgi:hypothetical protein